MFMKGNCSCSLQTTRNGSAQKRPGPWS